MLTEENLNKLIDDIVPSPYKPGEAFASIKSFSYVTNIGYLSKAKMSNWIDKDCAGRNTSDIHAIAMNWGVLRKKAGSKTWDESKLSFGIWIREDLDVPIVALSFIILHEIGHVDWAVRRKELLGWCEENQEVYADTYAYQQLVKLYGKLSAEKTLLSFGSVNGLGSKNSEDKKCLM